MSRRQTILRRILQRGMALITFMTAIPLFMSRLNLFLSATIENYKLSLFAFTLPYFFIANVIIFFILLRYKRYRLAILPALALLFTWGIARRTFAVGGIVDRDPKNVTDSLRILTWNVAMQGVYSQHPDKPKLLDSMLQTIKDQNPDVICMQEFVAKDVDTAESTYNLYQIVDRLGMPHYFYGFVPGVRIAGNHFGKIILSRYPIINEQHINFDSIKYNNSYEYVDILKGEDTIRIATFHLESLSLEGKAREMTEDPAKMGNSDTLITYSKDIYAQILSKYQNRVNQALAVNELIESSRMPIIACGDMNDVPSSYAYSLFSQQLSDAFLRSGVGFGRTFRSSIPSLRIDYIFYATETFRSSDTRVIHVPYSDHYPVVTKLSY